LNSVNHSIEAESKTLPAQQTADVHCLNITSVLKSFKGEHCTSWNRQT